MALTIRRFDKPPWTVLSVGGDLDVVGAPDLRQQVVKAVADGARLMAIDLSNLDFVDSFGLGAVIGALKRLRQRGGDLVLVCPSSRIRRVFEICDLDRILSLHDSLDTITDAAAGSHRSTTAASRP